MGVLNPLDSKSADLYHEGFGSQRVSDMLSPLLVSLLPTTSYR